jgi:hypothetical protein
MIEAAVRISGELVEESLRAELAQGDARARAVLPVLRHLLANDAGAMFGDEILARVRGMQAHLARQLLVGDGNADEAQLAQGLGENGTILSHLHALALEWQLAERLERDYAIDPVVPPLLQALIASPEPATQDLAMKLLAAQARWCQGQRRMQLALGELPGELFHAALLTLRSLGQDPGGAAEAHLRGAYDEAGTRLGLAARLVTSMGNAASVALDLRHGGSALFATALAFGSGQAREQAIVSTQDASTVRLALALRAAGLAVPAIEQQLLSLHGDASMPAGFHRLGAERAAAILSGALHARR